MVIFNMRAIIVVAALLQAVPVYADTPCQALQRQLDYYLHDIIGCHYTAEYSDRNINIYKECDPPPTVKTITYSAGGVTRTVTDTAQCCSKSPCYERDRYYEEFTTIYYNTRVEYAYCDNTSTVEEFGYGAFPEYPFVSSAICGITYPIRPPTVLTYGCPSPQKTLEATLDIPPECKCLDPNDPCCNSTDECCGKGPCCYDPACCGDVCCQGKGVNGAIDSIFGQAK
ncbi:hypothetical protein Geob_1037 [Geotalea daltonii FRC-32]|uniref:Uncharacterized protein n=1 Tax=Geotalea daltonii (strain DSM 22248 / JCM 15807 / FRC-32) TaxID=316067 RepID=B9M2L8_GEODF|nr:hypothetical protein Geob_1037 [Geotalea daltonii FRC-32]